MCACICVNACMYIGYQGYRAPTVAAVTVVIMFRSSDFSYHVEHITKKSKINLSLFAQ